MACSARAATGASTVPPSSVKNSRRLMGFRPASRQTNTQREPAQARSVRLFAGRFDGVAAVAAPDCPDRERKNHRAADDDWNPVMLRGAPGVMEYLEPIKCRHRDNTRQHMRRCPDQDRGKIDRIEADRLHVERAGRERHEGADRRYEAGEEHRPHAPAMEERLALRNNIRILVQRPARQDLALGTMADP